MERLKAVLRGGKEQVLRFTFQYGEIKSGVHTMTAPEKNRFTFQYGEIKSSAAGDLDRTSKKIYIPVWRD